LTASRLACKQIEPIDRWGVAPLQVSFVFLAVEWRPWRVIVMVQATCMHTSALTAAHFTWPSPLLPGDLWFWRGPG
jgi:hypothetical protein